MTRRRRPFPLLVAAGVVVVAASAAWGGITGKGRTAAATPLGPAIAYASEGHIWVSAANGAGATDLTPDVPSDVGADGESQPAWSPDGQRIVFVSTRDHVVTGENSQAILQELYVVSVGGDVTRRLTTNGLTQGKQAPAWSPDGRWIAYVTAGGQESELWVVRPDGSGQRRVAAGMPYVFESPRFAFAWSPRDPGLIAYVGKTATGDWALKTVDVDSGTTRVLATGPGALTGVAWSADGDRIAISVTHAARPELRRIEILTVDGATVRTIPLDLFVPFALSWSPDGSRFSVTGWPTPERAPQVYLVDAAGGPATPLTGFPRSRPVVVPPASGGAWWPTGERLFFNRDAHEPPYSVVAASINADGTCEQELSPGGRTIRGVPVWRPEASPPPGPARCADLWVLTELSRLDARTRSRGLPRPVGRGTPVRFRFEVWNVGTDPASGVVLDIAGPATGRPGVRLVSAGAGLSCPAGPLPVRCRAKAIAPGQALRGSIDVSFVHAGEWWFNVEATFAGRDGTAWNDVGNELVYVTPCRRAGTAGADRFRGTPVPDSYCGFLGSDVIRGGAGDDWLDGGAGADVIVGGAGRDTLTGGEGADTILSRDGEHDVVRCGPGRDLALADTLDQLSGCETIHRTTAGLTGRPRKPT